ncbi:MAG: ABC transporter permease [Acholeplasmataceae bacterium]
MSKKDDNKAIEKVNKDLVNLDINPSDFEFMQVDEKIYDKKFETKPIGYFKDAMIRFTKNKTNVVASLILFFLIFMAVLIPVITTKNYTTLQSEIAYLPPRVPIIERWGIMDGTRKVVYQPIDRLTIDPETGLGIPRGFNPEYINYNTLENYIEQCNNKTIDCVGGENIISLDNASTGVTIVSPELDSFEFDSFLNQYLELDIFELPSAGNPRVIILLDKGEGFEEVATFTTEGTHQVSPMEVLYDDFSTFPSFSSRLRIRFESDIAGSQAILSGVKQFNGTNDTLIKERTGFELSIFTIVSGTGGGRYVRQGGEMIFADFRYDSYQDAFGDRRIQSMAGSVYNRIIADNPEACTVVADPDNPAGWLFAGDCPILKVNSQAEPLIINGQTFTSYDVVVNYAAFMGYDDIPYFLFGTTASGRDLFAVSWVALRTSLLVGLIVASINITIGVLYGSIAGYYGGKTDLIMERFSEVVGRIPFLVTLSIFVALIGVGFWTLVFVLIVSGWIGVASVTRTQFYRYKRREYVLASRTLGAKDGRLIFRHILPNGIGTIITASILMIPGVIFAESTLSYLGYGIGHGQTINLFGLRLSGVSLGVLLSDGRNEMIERPYLTIIPSIIISILMITFNMFGNALRDAFNPSLRGNK